MLYTVSYTTSSDLHRSHFPKTRLSLGGSTAANSVSVTTRKDWRKAISVGLVAMALVVAGVVLAPEVYYRVAPADTVPLISTQEGTILGGQFEGGTGVTADQPREIPLPPIDETLPEGSWLIIPRIGVRTELQNDQDPETALATGVWMVPEYGLPGDTTMPLIAAAHRYGWQWWWKSDYWKYHSFYNLPTLETGDMVEVIDGQRKYYYEIYAGGEGEEITDYSADMILYTCKFLNSPLRHFRYARLVDMSKDSQLSQR
ncbi:MAG: hypothetical protein M3Q81_02555 [bacterium]|nr:hypothetical protein [bacterium]